MWNIIFSALFSKPLSRNCKIAMLALITMSFEHCGIANEEPYTSQTPFTVHTSNRVIKIDQSFNGAKIVVFGTKSTIDDMVILLKGPMITVRVKKEYRSSVFDLFRKPVVIIKNVPTLYHLYSTGNLATVMAHEDSTALHLQITDNAMEKYCLNCLTGGEDETEKAYQFLINYLISKDILLEKDNNITIDKTLYSAKFYLPVDVKDGIYSFTSYLGKNGQLEQVKVMPVILKKKGLSGKIFYLSQNDPYYYAVLTIFWSMLMAVLANVITTILFFQKNN